MLRILAPATLLTMLGNSLALAEPDPYLWLEDIQGERALDWVRAHNKTTLGELQNSSVFEELYDEAYAIMTSDARLPTGELVGDEFHEFWQDKDNVRGVWRRTSIGQLKAGKPEWQVVLDIDKLAALENENWVYKSINCEGGNRGHCLLELSRGGKDESVFREFSLADRTFVDDGFVVPEAKTNVAWVDADTLVVATDWGADSMTRSGYAREARLWRRGTDLKKSTPLLRIDSEDTLLAPQTYSNKGKSYSFLVRLFADWNEYAVVPLENGRAMSSLPLPKRILPHGVADGRLIVGLKEDWSSKGGNFKSGDIIALDLVSHETELVYSPGATQAIDAVSIGADCIYLQMLDNVRGRIKCLDRDNTGWQAKDIALPDNGVVKLVATSGSRNDLFVSFESSVQPNTLYYVADDDKISTVAELPAMYDASNVVIRQQSATSKDGTRVPYFLIGRKDVLAAGDAPTILYGYGGFLIPILPVYYEDPSRPQHGALAGKLWLSRGGVLALSNIRGGGEFGPAWHKAALGEKRQNAFDDYYAVAEDLIARGVTTSKKLGALGRSNGGLLLGVALTQRPDLFAAMDIGVPLLDMRRYNQLLAGASWMGEYGNPDVPADWEFIKQYSPYQNLREGADYPTVFFYTSTKDDRVHPGHARKMAAKLGAMGYDYFYYENMEGGHGGTANQEQLAMRTALEFTYFIRMLMPSVWDHQAKR
ncbi:MAG TPA: prolyl oligopeptidase family serine peptidase [Woeseiaceae bacterium]|nr:prolyl oligopeptidase family serine peptidase [Woeseiaceae bacterium]